MSIPNRTVSITGVFAEDASTTIPSAPVSGVAYRNTAMTGTVIREGWAYKTIVDSANFNQALYEYSSVTAQVEKYGFLPWSNLTDYVQGSVCLGSNGKIYQAKQATGPSSTAYDPTTTPTVWDPVTLGVTEFLFHHVWSEYLLNRQDWLRADTFSWQPGTTYTDAYNHLVADISGISPSTETVGSYTVTYYQATDGHKICLADQETTVANIYNESGVAWYYILDTLNQRFKLPRTKYGFTGLRDTVGKYVEAGLPNITGYAGWTTGSNGNSKTNYGAFKVSFGGTAKASQSSGSGNVSLDFDASLSNSIYGSSTTVQPPATQMYLYFYVGNFSQSATEQTAGLNSELFNGKVDLNAANLSAQGKSLIAGLGMPSDTYEDLTLGATGTEYTAPANGCVVFSKRLGANTAQFIALENTITTFRDVATIKGDSGNEMSVSIPVFAGNVFVTNYNASGETTKFRFYYAKGSESEAI